MGSRKHRVHKLRRVRLHELKAAAKQPENRGATAAVPPSSKKAAAPRKLVRTSRPFEMRALGLVKLKSTRTRPSGNQRRRARALKGR